MNVKKKERIRKEDFDVFNVHKAPTIGHIQHSMKSIDIIAATSRLMTGEI